MMRLTLAIVGRTLFDADVMGDAREVGDALTIANRFIIDAVTALVPVPVSWPVPRNLKNRRAIDRLDAVIYRMIRERRAEGRDHGDFLSMLLAAQDEDDGGRMTDRQVRDEAMTLFLAGHETTANALAWAFYLLADHPDAYRRLAEEADVALGGRAPTLEDLPRLPYAAMVFKEALRLYPPAYMVGRQAIRTTALSDIAVEEGQLCFANIHGMHRRADYFPDPERFRPERFGPGEPEPPKMGYIPFGAGPRVCIGNHFALMEGQLCLAALAQRVRFERTTSGPIAPEPLVTLRPKGGVPMRVRRRRGLPS
jgi:cytochrome P450